MKTRSTIAIYLPLMLCACTHHQSTEQAQIPTIDVAQVQTDSVLLSKSYPGALSSVSSVDIVGRVNGTLITQNYQGGDLVQKGQILFQIEPTEYRDALAQAQAQLATAQSQYEYATKNYNAMTKALESDAVSQIEVLQAKNAMETAKASIRSAQAAVQTAQTNLGYCTVRAPFTGMITKGEFSPGSYISGQGAPVKLATIYNNSELFANFYIEDLSYIKAFAGNRGDKLDYDSVPVSFSEQLPHKYYGRLDYIAPDIDSSTGTVLVRVRISNPYRELRDGMYATIDLPYQVDPHAMLVRDDAITTSQSRKFLYVVNDSDKVQFVPIEVGEMANDSMRIVKSGINGNERYVTKALLKVRPGMPVHPRLTNY